MVLTNAEEVDAQTVGKDRFLDHVSQYNGLRKLVPAVPGGHIAERIETELYGFAHLGSIPFRRSPTCRVQERGHLMSYSGELGWDQIDWLWLDAGIKEPHIRVVTRS